MLRGCRWCVFTAALVFAGASFAQTHSTGIHIVGEAFTPDDRLCFEALEEGLVVRKLESGNIPEARFLIYYGGSMFDVTLSGGRAAYTWCSAWRMVSR